MATLRVEVFDTGHDLGRVGEEALQCGSPNRRPDEPFDDGGVLGIEGVEIRVGLPFLEQEFHLPAQPIGLGHFSRRSNARVASWWPNIETPWWPRSTRR